MTHFKAAMLITVNKAIYKDNTPEEVLAFHVERSAWWSSHNHDRDMYPDQIVFVRYAGTNEVIGRARVIRGQGCRRSAARRARPDLALRHGVP